MAAVDSDHESNRDVATEQSFADLFETICANIARVVRGKDHVIRLAVCCLVADGHLLVEDVPGVGKTSLAKAMARTVGGVVGRIQFTPDLLPSDVVGTSVWNQQAATFEYRPGPIFSNILLADEINRASPKTQSALLESMSEGQVTTDGETRRLPRPFMVIATQNPLEHQGTYPLPESQLDRFLMKIAIGYPDRGHEHQLLSTDGGEHALAALSTIVTPSHIDAMAEAAARIHISDGVTSYLLDLAAATRSHRHLTLGVSPRALLGLQRAVRVWAAASGRSFVAPDDVKLLASATLSHRIRVAPEAIVQGLEAAEVISEVIAATAVP